MSDLLAVKEVEGHLQERREDNADCTGHDEGDDSLVGIVLLSSSSDGLHQKLVSCDNIGSYQISKLSYDKSRVINYAIFIYSYVYLKNRRYLSPV